MHCKAFGGALFAAITMYIKELVCFALNSTLQTLHGRVPKRCARILRTLCKEFIMQSGKGVQAGLNSLEPNRFGNYGDS